MNLFDRVKTSIVGLQTNKSRSLLTILGIVIGIASIILVFSVSLGATNLILAQIQSMGSKSISVEPGREPEGPSDFGALYTTSLKDKELEAIQNPALVRGVARVAPGVVTSETISAKGETKIANIMGCTPELLDFFDIWPAEGDFFTKQDVDSKASMAVIGSEIKEELFGESDAVGEKIKIGERSMKVVGVFDPIGQKGFIDFDKQVLMPVTTAQTYLLGISHYHFIMVEAESEDMIESVSNDLKITLRELHGITDPDKDDFRVFNQTDAAERVGEVTGILATLLISVAAISLVVGGIGIMNIMLVSVVERTREIGLRKAVGATSEDILLQFLIESMLLTVVGGILGIMFGAFLAYAVALVLSKFVGLDWEFIFSMEAVFWGFGVSAAVGLIFGIYPAKEAAKKSPVEALRYE